MSKWEPNDKVKDHVRSSWIPIRNYNSEDLLKETTFRRTGVFLSLFGMAGMTWSKNRVYIGKKVCNSANEKYQAIIIFHELTHVAQQKDWGWFNFMMTYIWEWIKSGFSYQKMKKKGIEKEAYDNEKKFAESIGYPMSSYA